MSFQLTSRRAALLSTALLLAPILWSAPVAFVVLSVLTVRPNQLPEGWMLKDNKGRPEYSTTNDSGAEVIRLQSHCSSYSLERSLDLDVNQFPYLTWKWKVTELPVGGDFRHSWSDDQAAQVLVAFADRRVISYIWDSTAPQGTMQSILSLPLLHVYDVVCRSGPAQTNQWLAETRNLVDDFRKAYDRYPPHIRGIRIQINSQHTGTSAESYFGDISLRSAPR